MEKLKKQLPNIALALVFLIGFIIFSYPSISNLINTWAQNKELSTYNHEINQISTEKYDEMIKEAQEFNKSLVGYGLSQNAERVKNTNYNELLSVGSGGIIGYLTIDKIDVKLPIYHGTEGSVLQMGVGHLEGSSLPIEGESVHCVLSGHTGLPSAKLLSNLTELKEGDTFRINVLNKRYTYKVDQILVVEPTEISSLEIEEGKEYATIFTCTPYGINTHRLLVRGERLPEVAEEEVEKDAVVIDSNIITAIISVILLIILFIVMQRIKRKKEKMELNKEEKNEKESNK